MKAILKSRKKQMTDKTHRLFDTITDHKKYEKNLTIILEDQLPDYLKSLVKGFDSFRLGGYIPGFNDGDPCVFWLLEPEFNVDGLGEKDDQWSDERYKHAYYHEESLKSTFREIERLIESIPKDFFTRVYGDYFQLIVTANSIDVNEGYYPE